MRQAEFDSLLTALYRCPGNSDAWSILAGDVARAFAASHIHLLVFCSNGRIAADVADDREAGAEYTSEYASRDLAAPKVLMSPSGQALWSHALLSADELARCPVQNELLPRVGVSSRSWVHSPLRAGMTFSSGILHPRGGDGLDERQASQFVRLHEHLQQAMHLHLILETARSTQRSLEAGLDLLQTGIILLDRVGRLLFANIAARHYFHEGRLRIVEKRLSAPEPADDAALRRVIAAATSGEKPRSEGMVTFSDFRLRAVPTGEPRGLLDARAAAVVLLFDDIVCAPDAALLLAYGLTQAEAALCAALTRGETLEIYAKRTGRALGTVRAQLRATFAKTNTHSQSALILFLLRAVASR